MPVIETPVVTPTSVGGSPPRSRRAGGTSSRRRIRAVHSVAACAVASLAAIAAFPSGASAAEAKVALGTAATYSVLGGQAVTNTGSTTLGGDLGVSPGLAITGFPPGIVGGTVHAGDAAASQAQSDVVIGYDDAAGRAPTGNVAGDLVGQVKTGGVYRSTSSLALSGTLTLDAQGDPNTVFVFQVASVLTTASASRVVLVNSAQACNVFWQVGSSATLGTTSDFKGTILALASITVTTGTTVEGRALARNGQVTLDGNTFTTPGCAITSPTTTTTPTSGGTPTDASPTGPGAARAASGADDGTDGSGGTGFGSSASGSETGGLARTGPSPWAIPLLGVGAALVLAGGLLVVESARVRGTRGRVTGANRLR